MQNLQAYHACLDVSIKAEPPDMSKTDWDIAMINKYVFKKREDGSTDIVFKVMYLSGDKSWVKNGRFKIA